MARSTLPPADGACTAWSRRRLLATCAAAALLSLGCVPVAQADGRLVQVDIIDRDTGEALHVYRDHGQPVVAGRPGARYAVRVINRSGERVMAVVAIDGVNILTGETAAAEQDGYVLEPYQRASLTGWRKSHSEVAAFEFTALSNSYAARTGRPDDVGVIGVAVFRETPPVVAVSRPWPVAPPPLARDDERGRSEGAVPNPEAAAAPPAVVKSLPAPTARGSSTSSVDAQAAVPAPLPAPRSDARAADAIAPDRDARLAKAAPQPTERLGTGHGERETSIVHDTTFDRLRARPQEIVRIRYDSLPNLVAAGIAPRTVAQARPGAPRAFPGDSDEGFVPDPPLR